MSELALQDARWLEALPQNLDYDFESFFWNQPDAAKAWFHSDEATDVSEESATVYGEKSKAMSFQWPALGKSYAVQFVSVVVCALCFRSF